MKYALEFVSGSGDDTRQWGPPFVGTESCYFMSINRNKKVKLIDVGHPSILLEKVRIFKLLHLEEGTKYMEEIC